MWVQGVEFGLGFRGVAGFESDALMGFGFVGFVVFYQFSHSPHSGFDGVYRVFSDDDASPRLQDSSTRYCRCVSGARPMKWSNCPNTRKVELQGFMVSTLTGLGSLLYNY